MNIKKGDTVIIVTGKDAGKKGKVSRAFPKQDKILVEGVNVKKKHKKSNKQDQKGSIIEIEFPIHVSNAMHIDPKSGKPTRVKFVTEGKVTKRVAVKSGETI